MHACIYCMIAFRFIMLHILAFQCVGRSKCHAATVVLQKMSSSDVVGINYQIQIKITHVYRFTKIKNDSLTYRRLGISTCFILSA